MSNTRKVALVVAFTHAIALALFLSFLHFGNAERSQAVFYWLIWFFIDFPISFATQLFSLVVDDSAANVLGSPKHIAAEIWYSVVHGVFGSIWWYLIVLLVGKIWSTRKLGKRRQP